MTNQTVRLDRATLLTRIPNPKRAFLEFSVKSAEGEVYSIRIQADLSRPREEGNNGRDEKVEKVNGIEGALVEVLIAVHEWKYRDRYGFYYSLVDIKETHLGPARTNE